MSSIGEPKRIGRPPGADPEQTRAAILDAALHAFAERGFEGASIREITNSIGVGHNLVRHYFGSKEDLWQAAVRHGLDPATTQIIELLSVTTSRSLRTMLRDLLEVLMRETAANPDAFRLFFSEAVRGGSRFDAIYNDVVAPISTAVVSYATGNDAVSADVDLAAVGLFVFGALFSPFTFEGFATRVGFQPLGSGEPFDEHVERLIDMILAGLMAVRS